MHRHVNKKKELASEITASVRKLESRDKKPAKIVPTVKPLPQRPVLNSVLRLDNKVKSVRNDLNEAKGGGQRAENLAVSLAREKIVNSPRTNSKFRQVIARKVDFRPDEQIFSHLASLSVVEDEDVGIRKRKNLGRLTPDQDPGTAKSMLTL